MYATLFAMAVVRLVLTIALATVIIRSGYRIGYRATLPRLILTYSR